jgi:hypothetical protein
VAIEFTVSVANVPGAGTKNVTITLANHTRTLPFELSDFDNPPSRMEMRQAVETLVKAAYWGVTGTPAQRLAAVQAGISRLAYFDYAAGTLVNP